MEASFVTGTESRPTGNHGHDLGGWRLRQLEAEVVESERSSRIDHGRGVALVVFSDHRWLAPLGLFPATRHKSFAVKPTDPNAPSFGGKGSLRADGGGRKSRLRRVRCPSRSRRAALSRSGGDRDTS